MVTMLTSAAGIGGGTTGAGGAGGSSGGSQNAEASLQSPRRGGGTRSSTTTTSNTTTAPPPLVAGRLSREPRLANKIALVTGASRGIGQAVAVRFVEEGAKVICTALEDCGATMALIASIDGIRDVNDVATSVPCDISVEEHVRVLFDTTERWIKSRMSAAEKEKKKAAGSSGKAGAVAAAISSSMGGMAGGGGTPEPVLDILVNNAAQFIFRGIQDATVAEWTQSCNVNIIGTATVTRHALPLLKRRRRRRRAADGNRGGDTPEEEAGGRSIIFLGSISSFRGQPNCATYAATKAALVQMAKSTAYDLAKYDIRANAVCPGTIETPISQVERKQHRWTYEEWEAQKVRDVMMGRVGNVREVANAVLFYASDESSYCTGGVMMVDGGQSACTVMGG